MAANPTVGGKAQPPLPPTSFWRLTSQSTQDKTLELRVRLTPKSSRDAVDGLIDTPDGPALKARVRAIPENGAANKALIATIANWLSLPKSSISLSAGTKSRIKMLSIVSTGRNHDRIENQLSEHSQTRTEKP